MTVTASTSMKLPGPLDRCLRAVAGPLSRLPPALILWLAAGSLTAIFGIFALTLYLSRLDVTDAAWTASTNLVAAVSQQIQREIELLDMSLLDLRDGAAQAEVMKLPPHLRQAILFDRSASAHGLGALMLLDSMGHLVEQANMPAPKPIDFSAQDFFQVQRDHPAFGMYVSRPFVSLVDGETSIAISRRVDRDGVFAGVAVGTIRLSHFKDLFGRLDLGANGSMSLIADDGTLVMRQPFVQTPKTIRWNLAVLGQGSMGTFQADSIVDGRRRQYFYSRVGKFPLLQLLGRSVDDVYHAWWIRAAATAFALFLLGNTILLLIVMLQSELRRRRTAEAELAILASTDALTGLANRRTFDARLDEEWSRAAATGMPMALLMIDIDHFKALNDAIGHQGGDAVLAAMGACLRRVAEGTPSLAARYGGEEFVILLPGADGPAARTLAERLRVALRDLDQPHPGATNGRMTASIGVASLAPFGTVTSVALIRAADRALYRAKRSGRDRIVMAIERAAA